MRAHATPPPLLPVGAVLELIERAFARAVPLMFGGCWSDQARAETSAAAAKQQQQAQQRRNKKGKHHRGHDNTADEPLRDTCLLPRSLYSLYVHNDALTAGGKTRTLHDEWRVHATGRTDDAASERDAQADAALRMLGTTWTLQLPQYLDAACAAGSATGEQAFGRIAVIVAVLLANQCWRGSFVRSRVLEQVVVFQVKQIFFFFFWLKIKKITQSLLFDNRLWLEDTRRTHPSQTTTR